MYLRAKFDVSSIILTSFRWSEQFYHPLTPQNEPLKGQHELGLTAPPEVFLSRIYKPLKLDLFNIDHISDF